MTPEVAAVVVAAIAVPQLPELARIIAASLKDKRAAQIKWGKEQER